MQIPESPKRVSEDQPVMDAPGKEAITDPVWIAVFSACRLNYAITSRQMDMTVGRFAAYARNMSITPNWVIAFSDWWRENNNGVSPSPHHFGDHWPRFDEEVIEAHRRRAEVEKSVDFSKAETRMMIAQHRHALSPADAHRIRIVTEQFAYLHGIGFCAEELEREAFPLTDDRMVEFMRVAQRRNIDNWKRENGLHE